MDATCITTDTYAPYMSARGESAMRYFVVLTAFLLASFFMHGAEDAKPSAERIVENCVSQMSKSVRLRSSYTYKLLDETKDLDRWGQVKDTHKRLVEVVYFAGKPFERLLEKDGKALSAGEQKREEEKMNRAAEEASKLTEEQRESRQGKLDREREKDTEWFHFFPEAYNFTFLPMADLNGRASYVLQATAKEGYRGKYAGMLSKAKCKLFIDARDYTLARIEGEVLQPISFGLFLARLSEGTRVTFEQVRVNDEVWLPKSATVHASARALIKTFRIDERLVFSDYRKFQSESRMVPVSDK